MTVVVTVAVAVGYAQVASAVVQAVMYDAVTAALVVAVGLRVRSSSRRLRPWWLAVMVGFAALVVGNVVWDVGLLRGVDPTGGAADWMFVLGYGLTAVGMVGVASGRLRGGWVDIGMEAVAVGALVGALSWVWGGAAALDAGRVAGAVAASLLVVFSAVRTLALLRVAVRHRDDWRLAVAGLGMTLWLLADVAYAGLLESVTYKTGGWLDAVWLAATLLLAVGLGGGLPPAEQQAPPRDRHVVLGRRIALVMIASLAPAFLMLSALTDWGERFVLAAALLAVGLAVVVRVEALTTRNQHVRDERDEAEARYRQLFEQTSSPMLLIDPDGGRIVDANPAATGLYGHSRTVLQGMLIGQINTLSEAEIAAEMRRARHAPPAPFEFRHRVASGATIPVDVFSGPVTVDGRQLLLSIIHDASARHAALDQLNRSKAQWRQLAELAEDMVYRATYRDGRLASLDYVNPAGQSVLGLSPTSLMVDPTLVAEHLHTDDRRRFLSPVDEGGRRTTREVFRWSRPDGETVWLEDRRASSPVGDGGVAVVGVVRDITAQQRTEQALREALRRQEEVTEELHRVDQMKSTFLQAVSHELRTPLTSLLGFLDTLDNNPGAVDQRQHGMLLHRAHANAQRLQRLLDSLLDVNRLASGLVVVDRQVGDVATMVTAILGTMDVRNHNVRVEATDGEVVGDLVLIERALENLLDNAVRHTPAGTNIDVGVSRDGDVLHVTVEDDGPGLPPTIVGQVFEPFTQGPQAGTDPNPGVGIGLALAARIARLHGGALTAENRNEGGTRVRLSLPAPRSERTIAAGRGSAGASGH